MTKKEENIIKNWPVKLVFSNLTSNEKNNLNLYKKILEEILTSTCESTCLIRGINGYIFYGEDYNMIQERDFKEGILNKLEALKKRFSLYHKQEKEDINKDITVNAISKKALLKTLDNAIKNIHMKIKILYDEYSTDIEYLDNKLSSESFKVIVGAEVDIRKEEVVEMKNNINSHCKQILCNNKDLIKLKSLKPLKYVYGPIVEKTILDNIVIINDTIIDGNTSKLAELFITAFNHNIELQKINELSKF